MDERKVSELLLRSIEHKKCGIHIFEAALECAVNEDLREELEARLRKAACGADFLDNACFSLGMDPDRPTPGRRLTREISYALIEAMQRASINGPSSAAQLVACECLAFAENRQRLCRILLAQCARLTAGEKGRVMQEVCAEIGDEETSHFCRFRDWSRELWMDALGMHAILPPPVTTEYKKTGRDVPFPGRGLFGDFLKNAGSQQFPGLQFGKRSD